MSVATSTVSIAMQPELAVPEDFIWRLSVEQYHAMIHAGILTEADPVELLEGWLIPKMPKNPPHGLAIDLAREILTRLLPNGWHVKSQDPLTLADSEPEPDVLVVRGERRQYRDKHPGAAEVWLLIEVSDTTLARDRGLKKRTYARAAVPVYWIINLVENQLEVYTAPSGATETPDYGERRAYALTEAVPLVIEEQELAFIPVRELFP